MDLRSFFERCYCVSLQREPGKWADFQTRLAACNWPFVEPVRFLAIDGKNVPHHPIWTEGGGAWGCLQSHLSIIQTCLNENVRSVLILEEDAEPVADFASKCQEFLSEVPKDWAMLYLGGQHLAAKKIKPLLISEHVVIPGNVNRTHAYALTRRGMEAMYLHLVRGDWWAKKVHIDHRYGQLHEKRTLPVYCPVDWLMWQAAGKSNVCGKPVDTRDWSLRREHLVHHQGGLPWAGQNFHAIIGLHSSGSSAIAGVCYHLGMYLGDHLVGFYGNDPKTRCGFEARGMMQLCERIAKFPSTELRQTPSHKAEFRNWIRYATNRARTLGTVPGVKYPHLCRLGAWLREFCDDRLRLIHCVRPVKDSITSLASRKGNPSCSKPEATKLQRWLNAGKKELLASVPREYVLDVPYYELLASPAEVVTKIAAFTNLRPTQQQIDTAVSSVKPEMQHIGKAKS